MNVVCVAASNMMRSGKASTSLRIGEAALQVFARRGWGTVLLDLRNVSLSPCNGCGGCFTAHRCAQEDGFNNLYEKLIHADAVLFVSPHYAPIPAKLCMLLEKMEQLTFLHWGRDNAYHAETWEIPAGVFSHGGGAEWALSSYRAMVNDTIANALETIQFHVIPFSPEWPTGISLPVARACWTEDSPFPQQSYRWEELTGNIEAYASLIANVAEN